MFPDDALDDPVDPVVRLLLQMAVFRISNRVRDSAERDLADLEKRVGRELPAVRAQLERLFEFSDRGPAILPPAVTLLPPDDVPAKKRPGRPKKSESAPADIARDE